MTSEAIEKSSELKERRERSDKAEVLYLGRNSSLGRSSSCGEAGDDMSILSFS